MAMPKTSAEIVAEMGAKPSSPAKRQAALNKILTDNRHDMRLASTKVAQGVVARSSCVSATRASCAPF